MLGYIFARDGLRSPKVARRFGILHFSISGRNKDSLSNHSDSAASSSIPCLVQSMDISSSPKKVTLSSLIWRTSSTLNALIYSDFESRSLVLFFKLSIKLCIGSVSSLFFGRLPLDVSLTWFYSF